MMPNIEQLVSPTPSGPDSTLKDCSEASNPERATGDESLRPLERYLNKRSFEGRPAHERAKGRRRRGRPKKAWHLRSQYQRRRNEKRLRRWQVEDLIKADRHAKYIGLPLNTFGTIRWAKTGGGEDNIPDRWTAFWKSIGAWFNRQGLVLAYLYVHENPSRPGGGLNTHFLVSAPTAFREALTKRMVEQLAATTVAVMIEPRCRTGRGDTRLNYMLKGTDRATAIKFHLISAAKGWDYAQGKIEHKRAGTSANIGKAARKRYKQLLN